MRAVAFAGLVTLAACAGGDAETQRAVLGFVPQPDGVGVPGTAMEVGFGRTADSAIPALTKLAGPVTGEVSCGTIRSVDFRDGLTASFRNERFVGWVAEGRSAGAGCAIQVSPAAG